jgi:hypothetical protein
VAAHQVDPDRVCAGIEPLIEESFAELHDLVLELHGRPSRTPAGTTRPRLEADLAFDREAPAELLDPPSAHAVVTGHLALRSALDLDRGDHQPGKRHRAPLRVEV